MIGIILGSGLKGVVSRLEVQETVPLEKIMGPVLQGKRAPLGHERRLIKARWKGKELAVFQGRLHFYEGFSMEVMVEPIRRLKAMGADKLILTCAAGAVNPKYRPGDFVAIKDHLHYQSGNPLHGTTDFVDCTEVYDAPARKRLVALARKMRVRAHEGVYASLNGPSYETPAEIKALGRLGADVVGMSITAEAITGRSLGMRVAGLGWVSNMGAGVRSKNPLSHREVLELGAKIEEPFSRLLFSFIESF